MAWMRRSRPRSTSAIPTTRCWWRWSSFNQPRTIVWCPGNQALFGAGWSPEEERVLAVLRRRLEALGYMPRLILVAPPIPLDEALGQQARERRDLLISSATAQGWARSSTLPRKWQDSATASANRVQDGLFTTRYLDRGGRQDKLAQVDLRDEMARAEPARSGRAVRRPVALPARAICASGAA